MTLDAPASARADAPDRPVGPAVASALAPPVGRDREREGRGAAGHTGAPGIAVACRRLHGMAATLGAVASAMPRRLSPFERGRAARPREGGGADKASGPTDR